MPKYTVKIGTIQFNGIMAKDYTDAIKKGKVKWANRTGRSSSSSVPAHAWRE